MNAMVVYRAYVIGPHDHFIGVHRIECADDRDAIDRARHYADGHDIEIWRPNRTRRRL